MRQRINRSLIGGQQLITASSATGINTVVDAQLNSGASTWPQLVTTDPYFNYVPLLLNTNTTNAAQNNTFLDSSTNNFNIMFYFNYWTMGKRIILFFFTICLNKIKKRHRYNRS